MAYNNQPVVDEAQRNPGLLMPSPTSLTGDRPALGFLGLPRELRDMVYPNLLCDFQQFPVASIVSTPRTMTIEESAAERLPCWNQIGKSKSSVETAILRVNSQIHDEAMEVMVKRNKFIRIFLVQPIGLGAQPLIDRNFQLPRGGCLAQGRMPILACAYGSTSSPSIVHNVKNAFMSYYITEESSTNEVPPAGSQDSLDLVILGRDLPTFTVYLASQLPYGGSLTHFQHRLVFHDPLNRAHDPRYDNTVVQRPLIEPFSSNLYGIPRFEVEGDIDPKLARSVEKKVRSIDPTVLLSRAWEVQRHRVELERRYISGRALAPRDPRNIRKYVELWDYSTRIQHRLLFLRGRVIPEHLGRLDSDFDASFAQLDFARLVMQLQTMLRSLHDFGGPASLLSRGRLIRSRVVGSLCQHATPPMIEAMGWATCSLDVALAMLCIAQLARLSGNQPVARNFISNAAERAPGHPDIELEQSEIEKMEETATEDMA